jgi:hypothetical protein
MDKNLAETIAAACCEKCGRELIDDEKIHCAKCEDKCDDQGS